MANNNFTLTLDTIAPQGAWVNPASDAVDVNVSGSITAQFNTDYHAGNVSNTNDAKYITYWYDTNSSASALPSSFTWEDIDYQVQNNSGTKGTRNNYRLPITFSSDGQYYLHVALLDSVGNISFYTSHLIVNDTYAPTVTSGSFYACDYDEPSNHAYTNASPIKLHIAVTDPTQGGVASGIQKVEFWGNPEIVNGVSNGTHNIIEVSGNDIPVNGEITVSTVQIDTTSEGTKQFYAKVYDKAGNYTTVGPVSIVYDATGAGATIDLVKTGTNPAVSLPTFLTSSDNDFSLVISATDGTSNDIVSYKIYGDLVDTSGVDPVALPANANAATPIAWTTSPSRVGSETITDLAFSASEGEKQVHVEITDQAGNTTTITKKYVYDNSFQTCTISTNRQYIAESGTGKVLEATLTINVSDPYGIDLNYPKVYLNGTLLTLPNGTFTVTSNTSVADVAVNSAISGTITFSKANFNGAVVGANTIRVDVQDMAGNTATDSCQVTIEDAFTLGTVTLTGMNPESPNASTAGGISYNYNESSISSLGAVASFTGGSAPTSGVAEVYVWTDNTPNTTTVAQNTTSGSWDTVSTNKTISSGEINRNTAVDSASNYLHIKVISNVGNIAYAHVQFRVDTTAPTVTVSPATLTYHTNVTTVSLTIIPSDSLSGIHSYRIFGKPSSWSGTETGANQGKGTQLASDISWTQFNGNGQVSATIGLSTSPNEPDSGMYAAIVEVKDNAGNITTVPVVWEYDKTPLTSSATLKEADGTTNKGSPSSSSQFKVVISVNTDATDASGDTKYYKIYGDCNTAANSTTGLADGDWTEFTGTEVTSSLYYCTNLLSELSVNGETKTIYVAVKDDAGNVSSHTLSFTYNPQVGTLTVNNLSNSRISCLHVLRKSTDNGTVISASAPNNENDSSTILDAYCDVVSFDVGFTQDITEWKVMSCLSIDTYPQGANSTAISGSAITPMAKRSGSFGRSTIKVGNGTLTPTANAYSGTISGNCTKITLCIDGQDYQAALRAEKAAIAEANSETYTQTPGDVDGLHYIIVFVKNNAGSWTTALASADVSN